MPRKQEFHGLGAIRDVDPASVYVCPECKTVRPKTRRDCPVCDTLKRHPDFKLGHVSVNVCCLGVDLILTTPDGMHMLSLSWNEVRSLVLKKGRKFDGLNPAKLLKEINRGVKR